jgi:hypothetical protein
MQIFNIKNLKQARSISFDPARGTISISTSDDSDGRVNLSRSGDDDKVAGFSFDSYVFVVRLLEHVTGYQFEPASEDLSRFRRTNNHIS